MGDLLQRLRAIRGKLKSGEYDGADLMEAWCAAQDGADMIDRLRAALERLGSMEAFVVSRAVTAHDAELIARIEYAQEALRGDAQQELCPHGFVLADNICGPCSEGRANRTAGGT